MLYAIICEDAPESLPRRQTTRPRHVARLQTLQEEGRLVIAGPHPALDNPEPGQAGFTGSLIIAEFPSLQAAQAWANDDPYVEAGVYANVTIKPFLKVLPN